MNIEEFGGVLSKFGYFIKRLPTVIDSETKQLYYIVDREMDMKARTAGVSSGVIKGLVVHGENHTVIYSAFDKFTQSKKISWPLLIVDNEVQFTVDLNEWLQFNNISI